MPCVLALPAIPPEYDGAVVVSGINVISVPPRCELAGAAFFERVERRWCVSVEKSNETPGGASSADSTAEVTDAAGGSGGKKKNYKDNSSIAQRVRQVLENNVDLYSLVCVEPTASLDDIRKQWRKLALLFHPDKAASTTSTDSSGSDALVPGIEKLTPEELHDQFLKRHNAFEILIDPSMRRQYDSYAHFDDRLPDEHELAQALNAGPAEFLKLCRTNFEKEARWCSRLPVPDIGDEATPVEKVKEFYKYWATYESWRDFTNAGEHHPEDAQDRDERKWMQKENWKVVKAMLKAERQRVLKFVSAVEARDPRLKKKAPPKLTGAAAKAKALADVKAAILARRKKLAEGRSAVRQIWRDWVVEKGGKDETLAGRIDKFLLKDENVLAISDLAHILSNVIKRYKEPSADAATVVKAVFIQQLPSSA